MESLDHAQRKVKNGDCVFFLHIPKTAGTTAYFYIADQFHSEVVFIVPDENYQSHFEDIYPDQLSNFHFFRQHATYDHFRYLPRKPVMITFLRNPVDRVYSFYKHVRRVKHHPLHQRVLSDHIDLVEFMNLTPIESTNFQTCALTGYRFANQCKDPGMLLEVAKMRLHEMDFFGIQESFEESMSLLSHHFHWELKKYASYFVAPVSDRKLKLDAREIEAVRERNKLDFELYQYAVEIFNQRVDAILN
jgi:hypothetical protein